MKGKMTRYQRMLNEPEHIYGISKLLNEVEHMHIEF